MGKYLKGTLVKICFHYVIDTIIPKFGKWSSLTNQHFGLFTDPIFTTVFWLFDKTNIHVYIIICSNRESVWTRKIIIGNIDWSIFLFLFLLFDQAALLYTFFRGFWSRNVLEVSLPPTIYFIHFQELDSRKFTSNIVMMNIVQEHVKCIVYF